MWNVRNPRVGWVSSLTFQSNNANIACATYLSVGSTHVGRSTDGGNSWLPRDGTGTGALPDVSVHSLVIGPNAPDWNYLGTDLEVSVSPDAGVTWAVENSGFANVIVERLALRSPAAVGAPPQLHAFSDGRKIWMIALDFAGTPDYRMGTEITGLWFDPMQDGQGLNL